MQVSFLAAYWRLLLVIGLLDAVWLGVVAKNFYQDELSKLFSFRFFFPPALIFYLLYPVLMWFFVFRQPAESWQQVVLAGALYGFGVYATYDLTNWATIEGWSLTMTVIDVLWGTLLSAVAAGIVWWLIQR
jgi:uncharacterized membrane protein